MGDDTLSLERFISDFDSYIKAIMLEAEDRATGHRRSIDQLLALRRNTIGGKPTFAYLGFGLNIPDAVFDNPVMISLIEDGCDLISLINVSHPIISLTEVNHKTYIELLKDMHSYGVERSRGLDRHNIITVIMEEYHLDLQQALYWLSGYISKTVSNFLSNSCSLPTWGEKIDKAVSVYVDQIGTCVSGNEAWSYETKRYYGEDGLKVQACRKATFQRYARDFELVTREQFELETAGA